MTNGKTASSMGPHRFVGKIVNHAMGAAGAVKPLALAKATDFRRADIVIDGVDHSGPSFEVRLFGADEQTAPTPENGYLGEFNVFGHGFCFGDLGHCEVSERGQSATDLRDSHPLTPQQKVVVVTDGLKALMKRDGALRQVTLVPIVVGTMAANAREAARDVLKYDKLKLMTYK